MLEVNLKEIRNIITNYNQLLERIEKNNDAIAHNFTELNNYWHDGKQLALKESINLEQQRIDQFVKSIKNQNNVYKMIEKDYEKIGKYIKCNLDNKDLINMKVDKVISKLEAIITSYNSLGDISFYSRAYIINNQKEEFIKILKFFRGIKKEINAKLNQIEEIEKKIADSLNFFEIEEIFVNNYEKED